MFHILITENPLSEEKIIKASIAAVLKRSLNEGGFAMLAGEPFRPDATAWAVLALTAAERSPDAIIPACRRLAEGQLSDGRVPVIEDRSEAFWPTSLALMAMKKADGFERETQKAANFLVSHAGKHWSKKKNAIVAHDPSIKGWPWIESTHSWIEPTALAVVALKACGYGEHERVQEAVRMILDRQLPSGGWNMGNTRVFGKELYPIPESTGLALTALTGSAEIERVQLSIDYLSQETKKLRTPLATAWAIFGLSAWLNRPDRARDLILGSLSLQEKYGSYDTTLLSQLLIAYFTPADLLGFLT
jgi:hypothetical protein